MAIFRNRQPAEQPTRIAGYRQFGGVDMETVETEVDPKRSPNAPNMIVSKQGYPQKRTGYRLVEAFGARINGLHPYLQPGGTRRMAVHAGTKLFICDPDTPDSKEELMSGLKDARSSAFVFGGKLYVQDGANYVAYDGKKAAHVEEDAYVPTTTFASPPGGGGEELELVNLLQPRRVNKFIGTATATVYQLDAMNITSVDKCEKLAADGVTWTGIASFTANLPAGKVTFAAAPGPPPVTGEDNVRITFSKKVDGSAEKIKNCTINTFFGIGNDTRVFVSGNATGSFRHYDWYSGSGRADYFPDLNYNVMGAETSAVMGYLKQYDNLVVVKEGNDQDVSLFLRSAEMGDEGKTVFVTRQGLAGVGAVSKYCFATLFDDNMFLSREGVFGLDTSSVTQQRTTQLRSYYVNRALTREEGLDEAVCCVNDGYLYLFVNGRAYVADAGQKNQNASRSFGYEWYYWTDVPARCACVYADALFFGTEAGELHRFKTERQDGMYAYSDNGRPIRACWTTKMDGLGDASKYKRIKKAGTGVTVMPFAQTSGTVRFVTPEDEADVREYAMRTAFDFADVDFADFSFGFHLRPQYIPARKKKRRAKMLQVAVENDKADEGFGVLEIRVAYAAGKDIKNGQGTRNNE